MQAQLHSFRRSYASAYRSIFRWAKFPAAVLRSALSVPVFACGSDDDSDDGKAGSAGAQTGGTGGAAGSAVGGAAGSAVGGAAGAEVGGAAGSAGTQGSCDTSELAPTPECGACVEEKCNPQCVAFFDFPDAKEYIECFFKRRFRAPSIR